MQEERVVRLGRGLGDGEGGAVGKAIAVADDEAIEGVVGIQFDAALLEGRAPRPCLSGAEADLAKMPPGGGQRFADQGGVAALGPSADSLWSGYVKSVVVGAGNPQWLEPKSEGRLGDRGPQPVLGRPPKGVEFLSGGVIWHLVGDHSDVPG
jgi:hypothetical protein